MSLEYACKAKNEAMLKAALLVYQPGELGKALACCVDNDFTNGVSIICQVAQSRNVAFAGLLSAELLKRAVVANSSSCLPLLLRQSDANRHCGLLLFAVKRHGDIDADIVRTIVQEVDRKHLREVDNDGNNALHLLATDKTISAPSMIGVFEAVSEKDTNVASLINQQNKNGDTVLHLCIWQTLNLVVKWLLEHGAEFGTPNKAGNTAVTLAATEGFCRMLTIFVDRICAESRFDAAELFTHRNNSGVSALEIIVTKDHACCLETIQNAFGYPAFISKQEFDYESPANCYLLSVAVDRLSTKCLYFLLRSAISNVRLLKYPSDFSDSLVSFLASRRSETSDLIPRSAEVCETSILHDAMLYLLRILPAQPKGRFAWHNSDPQQKRLAIAYMLLRVGAFPNDSKFAYSPFSLKHACAVAIYRYFSNVVYSYAACCPGVSIFGKHASYVERISSLHLPEPMKLFLQLDECKHFI